MGEQGRTYRYIDMEKSGRRMKQFVRERGYTVRDIQERLLLETPQPVYRWFQGKVLPSVNHLYMLSHVLGVHMEDMLVAQAGQMEEETQKACYMGALRRMCAYRRMNMYYSSR